MQKYHLYSTEYNDIFTPIDSFRDLLQHSFSCQKLIVFAKKKKV